MLSHPPVRMMAAHGSSSPPPSTQFQPVGMQSALEHAHHAQLLAMAAAGGGSMEYLGLPSKPPSSHLYYLLPATPPPPDPSLRSFFDGAEQQQLGSSGRLSLSLHGTKNADQPLMEYGMMDFGHHHHHHQQPATAALQLRIKSRFLPAAQELLNEFCSLTAESSGGGRSKKRPTKKTVIHEQLDEGIIRPNSSRPIIPSMDLLELQKIKSKLLFMLEEVDRRYRRYGEQMRALVESFEAVAGDGAARVYAALASAAVSKHFRCLRDGIAGQLGAVRKAMGEKGGATVAEEVPAGTSRGETPRLKLLDQCMRQHRASQQGKLEQHPWRPQRGLPELAVTVLRAWLFEHFLHPYPNDADKHILARQTGLSRSQVSNWFINARVRLWKPMVEKIYMEEMKDLAPHDSSTQRPPGNAEDDAHNPNPNPNPGSTQPLTPLPDHQLLIDFESLSSVISVPHHHYNHHHRRGLRPAKTYDAGGYGNGSRSGVSLTLGLQHHNGGGMSLSLLPNSHQHPDLFTGDGDSGGDVDGGEDDDVVDDEQQVHFSILDGEAVSLPYRNLMGAQLLHDLAR